MDNRPFRNIVVVLVLAAILASLIPVIRRALFVVLGLAGVALIVIATRKRGGGRPVFPGGGFLCDHCKFNDPRYCKQPARPNATSCPEFKPR